MKSGKHRLKINYQEFCAWLGNVIEPTEAYYFRHDS